MTINGFHWEALSEETKKSFSLLEKMALVGQFYLAGGTALALQLGHRISLDLDFFDKNEFDEIQLTQQLSKIGKFNLEKKAPQTILGILENTKVSFLNYSYPLLFPFKTIESIKIADSRDIACMKIDAIASRGAKRDFIDVYFAAKEFASLTEILKLFAQKYASLNYNLVHVKKSLVFFDDAESDPMPKMLNPVNWGNIKKFFQEEVVKLENDN